MNTHITDRAVVSAAVLGLIIMGGASAQTMPEQEPPATEPMLRGPTLPEPVATSLVQTDFQGRFQRLEGRPELAAVALLDLDMDRAAQVMRAASARDEAINALLLDNLDLVRQTTDAIQSKDNETAQRLGRELFDRFDPEHRRDPFAESMRESLTPEQSAEMSRLLDEYWKAWIDWELRSAKDKSDAARQRTQNRLIVALFQEELRQAYERTLRPYRERLERIYEIADPSPEQRETIRTIIIEFIRETRLTPTPEQRQSAARQVYEALDDDRRIKLFAQLALP